MAEQDERSQDPTPYRRQKAREEGQVARSTDLVSALLLICGLATLLWFGGGAVRFLASYAQGQLGGPAWLAVDADVLTAQWRAVSAGLARAVLPLLALLLGVAVLVNLAQVGWLFLPEKALPDLKRLNVLAALKQMFSAASAMRLVFGLLKITLVAAVAAACIWSQLGTILSLVGCEVPQIAQFLSQSLLWTALKIAAALAILALCDYAYQRWKHERDLRMTPQEVREELRNQQGDPQIIARRRAVQRQLVLNRLKSAVPKADVVITNPTELAIAIQYEPAKMAAPVVVAKGAGVLAARIRQLALENGIPIVERKPLAQALYKQVEINRPIPAELYAGVAEVLAYVYQLTGKTASKAEELAGTTPGGRPGTRRH